MKASTSCKLSKNLTEEVSSDYEHYLRTFIYKVPKRNFGDDIFIKPISRLEENKNNRTMHNGYSKQGPKYMNLSRLVGKVFHKEVLTNNFFSSMNKSGINQSFIKRQRLSFH
mmetsp:Transcript_30505/g.27022  ORF Transcript_30505/g.27022 Transcript_30505/m.27022 type:complete len:112 (+) Transcript_30505:109-444(+)